MALVDIIRLFPNTNVTFRTRRPGPGITTYSGHLFSQTGTAPPVLLSSFTPTAMEAGVTFSFTAPPGEIWVFVVTATGTAATRLNATLSYAPPPPPPQTYTPALQPGARTLEWAFVRIERPVNVPANG